MNVTAGKRLRSWREAQGLTQKALADLVDEEQSTISRLESSEFPPSLDLAIKLSRLARKRGGKLRLPVDMWLSQFQKTA